MNPELPFIIFGTLGMTGLVGWLLKPVIEGIGRRLAGNGGGDVPMLEADVEQLQARVAELEGVAQRLAEVEDRLDFAERLLARQRPAGALPDGEG